MGIAINTILWHTCCKIVEICCEVLHMIKIAFLVPHDSMASYIKEMLVEYTNIYVKYCEYNEHISAAEKLIKEGYEIIIARSVTALLIKENNLDINLVELSTTGFDLIRALEKAKTYGSNIAVVAHHFTVTGIDYLASVMKYSCKQYLMNSTIASYTDIENCVLQAVSEGADVVVGGGVYCEIAQKHSIPAVFIENGKESVLQAVEEALRIQNAIESEKIKRRLFEAVLDNVHDGIITVDCNQRITSINLKAQQIFNMSLSKALEQNISDIWPGMDISNLIKTEKEEMSKIVQLKALKVICSKIPIIANLELHGALITFQDITKVQQAEAHIRKEIYSKGHVAKKNFADIYGSSQRITHAITLGKKFATTNSNILIVGETGTGKEIFAQSIHNHSARQSGPFVAVNCGAFPSQILESELFGYVGGAFTGANKEGKAGLFELAHGGTIFLDEISEMDYVNQSRFLRVLQERSIMRLGSDKIISVDIRIIAATNKDLKELVLTNKFREDLFFRLNVLKLDLPPLRECKQDIKSMVEGFISKPSVEKKLKFDAQAIKVMEKYSWPGNVRELQNTIERLSALCQEGKVHSSDVESVLENWNTNSITASIHDAEIKEITDALNKAKGNKSEASKILGIDRSTLWRKMCKLNIKA